MKLIWCGPPDITAKWKSPPIQWHAATEAFAVQFQERFVVALALTRPERSHTEILILPFHGNISPVDTLSARGLFVKIRGLIGG